jgi:hypothetical protein
MSEKNPYLVLIEESEPGSKKQERPAETPTAQAAPPAQAEAPAEPVAAAESDQGQNPYMGLFEDATPSSSFNPNEAAWWAGLGGAGGYLSSGAGLRRLSPSPDIVAGSRGARMAEALFNAPPDILKKIMEQQRRIPGVQAAIEGAIPGTPAVQPETGGGRWSQNWAGIEQPVEEGVPQASARYNRSKGQGKVTGRLTKMYGPHFKLNIHQMPSAAEAAATEARMAAEAAERARQIRQAEQATMRAAKIAPALTVVNRVLTGAGLGLGAYDVNRRLSEGDKLGAGLSAAATGLGTVMPPFAPLAAAGMALYDSPEARQRLIEAMQPGGAYEKRMEGRFGLD